MNASRLAAHAPQLADDENIKRGTKSGGHLIRHRHPAARKPRHDDVTAIPVLLEEASQDLASTPPVTEQTVWHARTPRRGLFTGQGRATGRCQEALAQALPAEPSRARGSGPFPG